MSSTAATSTTIVDDAARMLVGLVLGRRERRYGLMTTHEALTVLDVVGVSGDLAVADRLAFLAAANLHVPVVVLEHDGRYVACVVDGSLEASDLATLRIDEGALPGRILSLACERGIVPMLGPLVA